MSKENVNAKQPPPSPSNAPAVWDLVEADMRERDQVGAQKYGTRLQPHNGRDALVDAYQEALDLVVYLRQAIYEKRRPTILMSNLAVADVRTYLGERIIDRIREDGGALIVFDWESHRAKGAA